MIRQFNQRVFCLKQAKSLYLLILGVWGLSFIALCQEEGINNTQNFDFNWKFYLGDDPQASKMEFDDKNWRLLDLPHDWSIEQPFNLDDPQGWRIGYLPGGIGWYRKNFEWKKRKEEHVFIRFDGIYMNSEVWINGHHLGKRPYGYISFEYELSPYLKEGTNVIAVRVDNSKQPSSRWYTGSGIYRHVWLSTTKNIYIPQWATSITTPLAAKDAADVVIESFLKNTSTHTQNIILETEIISPQGKLVGTKKQSLTLKPGINPITQQFRITNPNRWGPDNPVRYKAVHYISYNAFDREKIYTTHFGIRNIEISARNGFVLNDEKIKLNGVCNHHDGGPVGTAVPEDVLYRRLKLLKDMGCNAIRTSHNPAAPEFYTMCDTMGIMVLNEAFDGWDKPKAEYDYGLYFAEWWKQDLADFIKRDRNHPSVIMWSIGNEVPKFEASFQKQIIDLLKSIDPTRPVTQARGSSSHYTDVIGFNGEGERPGTLENYHAQYPDKPLLGTEMTHTLQTRGVYATKTSYRSRDFPSPREREVPFVWEDFEKIAFPIPDLTEKEVFHTQSPFYQSSYDNATVRIGVKDQHRRTIQFDYLIGTFRWTGFDYLGEANLPTQPERTANFGILDLCGFPKDHYYLYQSLWSSHPMVHILPHWTHPGKEGVLIPVVAYTNAESAELFLNGRSLGEKVMARDLQLVWYVPYQPGTLEIVARSKGKIVATKKVVTAEPATHIHLTTDKIQVRPNKRDVVHIEVNITDQHNQLVPDADHLVQFKISGPGKIIGVENGDIADFSSMKASERRAFKGKCLVMIQTTDQPGDILLEATAQHLTGAQVVIKSEVRP